MSLLDIANKLDQSGFDPNEGKEAGGQSALPAGTYLVNFKGITHNAKGDRDFLMMTFEAMQGEHTGQQENIFPTLALKTSTGKDMPEFVVQRNISLIKVVGAMCDITVPNDVFAFDNETDSYEAIVPVLRPGVGTLMNLTIKETPNKKDPDRPYRNYEFKKADQPSAPAVDESKDPFKDNKTALTEEEQKEINSKLPF